MLKRKIEAQLLDWKCDTHHKPLVIKGIRQCGKTKSAATILKHPEKYDVYHAIKLGMYNVGRAEQDSPILSLPLYMAFLLKPNI